MLLWPVARFICHQHWSILPFYISFVVSINWHIGHIAMKYGMQFAWRATAIQPSSSSSSSTLSETQIRLDIIYYFVHFIIYVGKLWYAFWLNSTISSSRVILHIMYVLVRGDWDGARSEWSRCAVFHFHHSNWNCKFALFFKTFRLPIIAITTNEVDAFWDVFMFTRSSNNIFYFAISFYGQANRIRSTITTMYILASSPIRSIPNSSSSCTSHG